MNVCSFIQAFQVYKRLGTKSTCCAFVKVCILPCDSDCGRKSHEWIIKPTGNYYGLGELRACELYHSCSLLGIQQTHVTVVEDAELQDGLGNLWNRHTVAKYVSSSVINIDAEVLITFDAHGVSGHSNHSSAWAGVISAWENLSSNREIALYNLVRFLRLHLMN